MTNSSYSSARQSGFLSMMTSPLDSNATKSMKSAAIAMAALGIFGAGANASDDLQNDVFAPAFEQIAIVEAAGPISTSVPHVEMAASAPQKSPNKWLIGGAMALILAALAKLVGTNRVMNIVAEAGPALTKAAETLSKAPGAAARAVGEAVMSPMRSLMIIGSLALIGFTGISFLDLQWATGLATGLGLGVASWMSTAKLKRQFAKVRVRNTDQTRR